MWEPPSRAQVPGHARSLHTQRPAVQTLWAVEHSVRFSFPSSPAPPAHRPQPCPPSPTLQPCHPSPAPPAPSPSHPTPACRPQPCHPSPVPPALPPSRATPKPWAPDPPLLAVAADLLAGGVQAPVKLAVALAHGDAAAACDVIVHGAWTMRDVTLQSASLRKAGIPTPGLPLVGPQPRAGVRKVGLSPQVPLVLWATPVTPPRAVGAWLQTTFLGASRLREWGSRTCAHGVMTGKVSPQ